MAPAATPTLRQRELAARLRKLRTDSGMTVAEVAERLLISQTKLSRLETGSRPAQLRDVRDLCELYGVAGDVATDLMQLARQARERGWWQSYDLISEIDVYSGLEASAVTLHSFDTVLPGLLQTDAYARAILTGYAPLFPGLNVEQTAAVRQGRRERLFVPGGPEIWMVCDEAALMRRVGGRDVMRAQLEAMLGWLSAPNVVFQILPFEAGQTPGAQSNFMLVGLPDTTQDVVYVEGMVGFHFLEKPEELRRYRLAFDRLRAAADGPDPTRERIAARLREL